MSRFQVSYSISSLCCRLLIKKFIRFKKIGHENESASEGVIRVNLKKLIAFDAVFGEIVNKSVDCHGYPYARRDSQYSDYALIHIDNFINHPCVQKQVNNPLEKVAAGSMNNQSLFFLMLHKALYHLLTLSSTYQLPMIKIFPENPNVIGISMDGFPAASSCIRLFLERVASRSDYTALTNSPSGTDFFVVHLERFRTEMPPWAVSEELWSSLTVK